MATKKYKLTHDGVTIGNGTEGIPYSLSYNDGLLSLLRDGVPVGESIDLFLNHLSTSVIIRYRITDDRDTMPNIFTDSTAPINPIDPTNPDYYNSSADTGWKSGYNSSELTEGHYVWMAISTKTGEYIDPAWSISRINAYDGEDGSDGADGVVAESTLIVYFNPGVVTYPENGSRTYAGSIEICAYYGLTLCGIISVKYANNNPVDCTKVNNHYYLNSYTASLNSNTKFTIGILVGNEVKYRTLTLNVQAVPQNDIYTLIVSPNTLIVDVDESQTFELTATAYKNGELIQQNASYKWDLNSNLNLTCIPDNNVYLISNGTDSTTSLSNNDYVTCALKIGRNTIQTQTIPFLRNSLLLASRYIIRDKGEWNANEVYVNNSISGIRNEDGLSYIDIVWYDADSSSESAARGYYMPIVAEINLQTIGYDTPPPESDGLWLKALSMDFAYIETLISNTIAAQSVQSLEVLIKNTSNEIVAGMTSGDRISGQDPAVRIWAGSTANLDNENKVVGTDLTLAPFRVYEDGSVVALKLILAIDDKLYKVNLNMQLPKPIKGQIGYLMITDGNPYTISFEDNVNDSSIMLLNGNEYINVRETTLNKNGVYLITGQTFEKNRVWFLTYTGYVEIDNTSGLEWVDKPYMVGVGAEDFDFKIKFTYVDNKVYLTIINFGKYTNNTVSDFYFDDPDGDNNTSWYGLNNVNDFTNYQIFGNATILFNKDVTKNGYTYEANREFEIEFDGHKNVQDLIHENRILFNINAGFDNSSLKVIFSMLNEEKTFCLGLCDAQPSVIFNNSNVIFNRPISVSDITAKFLHKELIERGSVNTAQIPISGTDSALLINENTKDIVGSICTTTGHVTNNTNYSIKTTYNNLNYIVGPSVEDVEITNYPVAPYAPVNNP